MKKIILWVISWITLTICGCAGTDGSGFNRGGDTPPTPTPQANITRGKIESIDTEAQQITVDGVAFDVVPDTAIQVNGSQDVFGNLKTNQVVIVTSLVNGDDEASRAQQINYIANALGPIERFDPVTNEMVVLGQTYHIDENTLVIDSRSDGTTSPDLQEGDLVEVSALNQPSGLLLSTRIDIIDELDFFWVFGFITAIDKTEQTLVIGNLTVDYSAAELTDQTLNELEVGLEVIAIGRLNDESILEALDVSITDEGGNFTLSSSLSSSGFITEFQSTETFYIGGLLDDEQPANNRPLAVTSNTEFINGNASELLEGAHIRVRADYNSDISRYEIKRLEFIEKVLPTQLDLSLYSLDSSVALLRSSPRIYSPIQSVDLSTADGFFSFGQVQILSQIYDVGRLLPALDSEFPISDITDFVVGGWVRLDFSPGSSFTEPSVVSGSLISPLDRAIIIGNAERISINEIRLLKQTVLINEDSTCFTLDGFSKPCDSLNLQNNILYVEGDAEGDILIATYIVEI